jgi:hypothetical protein
MAFALHLPELVEEVVRVVLSLVYWQGQWQIWEWVMRRLQDSYLEEEGSVVEVAEYEAAWPSLIELMERREGL